MDECGGEFWKKCVVPIPQYTCNSPHRSYEKLPSPARVPIPGIYLY